MRTLHGPHTVRNNWTTLYRTFIRLSQKQSNSLHYIQLLGFCLTVYYTFLALYRSIVSRRESEELEEEESWTVG